MTTAEAMTLEADFRERSALARQSGDQHAEYLWDVAADLVRDAEAAAIAAAFERSRKRRTRKLGLRLTR